LYDGRGTEDFKAALASAKADQRPSDPDAL
jgi:hypothetical protein